MSVQFEVGHSLKVTETWRGQLWSSTSHVVVTAAPDEAIVTYRAVGTPGTYATSRGVPGRDHLSRGQRKMAALRTGRFETAEVTADLHTVEFFEPGSWARIALGWDARWRFQGWYVNFEEPPRITPGRIDTMDLVLDAVVGPDRQWHWKDREDFHQAIAEQLIDQQARRHVERTAVQTRGRLQRRAGPFAERWTRWRPGALP